MLFSTTTASASIYTFWKTDECPAIGQKFQDMQVGIMQAPFVTVDQAGNVTGAGLGGPYCVLESTALRSSSLDIKASNSRNADIKVVAGDIVGAPTWPGGGSAVVGETWRCVVCWYKDASVALPALSLLGTAVLIGGLVAAGAYQFGLKHARKTGAV
jgi:hypothetical protein